MPQPTTAPTFTIAWLAAQPADVQAKILGQLSVHEQAALRYHWPAWARPEQLEPPGDWHTWLVMAGRGWGKTRAGAEWIRQQKEICGRIALVGETVADIRDVVVCGESGILNISPPWDRPTYNTSKREVAWSNGAIAKTYSGEEPDQLRGPQHDCAYIDELAKFQYAEETWSNLQLGLRLGTRPRALVTTTPRPIPIIRELMRQAKDGSVFVTRGSTFANAANLAPGFVKAIKDRYAGTRLGRQELEAEVLEDLVGALWTTEMLEQARYRGELPEMERVIVAVDPSGFDGESGDAQGIVVAGKEKDRTIVDVHGTRHRREGGFYVLDDRSVRMRPEGWGRAVVKAFHDFKADRIVLEKNYGGAMARAVVEHVMPGAPISMVTATRGKHVRAEPVAALYEQGKVKHVRPFPQLEEQLASMTTQGWQGSGSPDRADALVWALTELSEGNGFEIIGIF
jgi:phage terminase large subunit-like protein